MPYDFLSFQTSRQVLDLLTWFPGLPRITILTKYIYQLKKSMMSKDMISYLFLSYIDSNQRELPQKGNAGANI